MDTSVKIVAASVMTSILVMCLAHIQSAFGYQYTARSLNQVNRIGLSANICTLGISEQMGREGFVVTDRNHPSDAVLEVTVQTDAQAQPDQGQGEKAHYSAMLVGDNDRVLLAAGGFEEATNVTALCDDIGRGITNQLSNRIDRSHERKGQPAS